MNKALTKKAKTKCNTNDLYWLKKTPTPNNKSNNRFIILATNEDDCTVTSPKKSIMPRPPPILVQNVEYIANLTDALTNIPDCKYQLKILSNNQVQIIIYESR